MDPDFAAQNRRLRLGKFEPRQLSFAGQDGLEEFGTFVAISPFDLFIAISYCSWVRKDLLRLNQIPPECLLEEYTMYYSPNIGPPEPANCKEECAQLAISKGAPFWSFNFKRNRCQFRRKGNGRTNPDFHSGNTDASCDFSSGCPSAQSSTSKFLLPFWKCTIVSVWCIWMFVN